ncbi:hypothetical protein ACQZV8_10725 [Magnetococcales bacterium HHB-1]
MTRASQEPAVQEEKKTQEVDLQERYNRAKEKLQEYGNFMELLIKSGLDNQTLPAMLGYTAAIKSGDTGAALEMINQQLEQMKAAGVKHPLLQSKETQTPEDLKEAVAQGEISQDLARELSDYRAQAALNEKTDKALKDYQDGALEVRDLLEDYKKSDPNYQYKYQALTPVIDALSEHVAPQKWSAIIQAAYSKIPEPPSKRRKKSTEPLRPSGKRAGQQEAKTMFDVVQQTLENMRYG